VSKSYYEESVLDNFVTVVMFSRIVLVAIGAREVTG
jgi:hypothetical protein